MWWQTEQYQEQRRIPVGGRLMPNSLLLTLIHGVKLGIANSVSRSVDCWARSLREHAKDATATGEHVGTPLTRALAPVAEELCYNVWSALESWLSWNRVISMNAVTLQKIGDEAGLGIFNK